VSSRWERILDSKPVPLQTHLLDEAARLLLVDLRQWPLPVQEIDVATGGAMAGLLSPDAPRPAPAVLPESLRLVGWELARAHDAYDDYMRNRRYQEAGIPERDRGALLLVSRWVLEQLLALSEATGGRVNRSALLGLVDRLGRGLGRAGEAG
jgi:hypothetical protein